MRKFLAIITFFIFCPDFFSQIKGDSVEVETTYSKKFKGRITSEDKEGYFIKISNVREIFLPMYEIKTLHVINDELKSKDILEKSGKSKVSTITNSSAKSSLNEVLQSEPSKELDINVEKNGFYKLYNLQEIVVDDLNFENKTDIKKFISRTKLHLVKNSLPERKFKRNLKDKLESLKYSGLEGNMINAYDSYKKYITVQYFLIGTGGAILVWTPYLFYNFSLLDVGAITMISPTFLTFRNEKLLYKAFFHYLAYERGKKIIY